MHGLYLIWFWCLVELKSMWQLYRVHYLDRIRSYLCFDWERSNLFYLTWIIYSYMSDMGVLDIFSFALLWFFFSNKFWLSFWLLRVCCNKKIIKQIWAPLKGQLRCYVAQTDACHFDYPKLLFTKDYDLIFWLGKMSFQIVIKWTCCVFIFKTGIIFLI